MAIENGVVNTHLDTYTEAIDLLKSKALDKHLGDILLRKTHYPSGHRIRVTVPIFFSKSRKTVTTSGKLGDTLLLGFFSVTGRRKASLVAAERAKDLSAISKELGEIARSELVKAAQIKRMALVHSGSLQLTRKEYEDAGGVFGGATSPEHSDYEGTWHLYADIPGHVHTRVMLELPELAEIYPAPKKLRLDLIKETPYFSKTQYGTIAGYGTDVNANWDEDHLRHILSQWDNIKDHIKSPEERVKWVMSTGYKYKAVSEYCKYRHQGTFRTLTMDNVMESPDYLRWLETQPDGSAAKLVQKEGSK